MKRVTASLFGYLLLAQSARAGDFVASANNWIEGRMAANSMSVGMFFFLFLGGLLASLLPCVYPIYPLTATLLRNRSGGTSSKWVHPLSYYLGLAGVYFLFGLIAAVTGGAFNQILRLPETNIALSFLFLLLALSTSGFIYFSFLSGGGSGETKPGLAGTFLMGMGAGLLASSCVGPFVVGILIKIAGSSEQVSLVTTLTAASKMLAFGFGLGVPLLAIALFGIRLPKSGSWMGNVQRALGLVILYFSYVYLDKGLSGLGFQPEKIRLVFFGALIVLVSIYKLQGTEVDSFKRTGRALAGLLLVIGFFCMQHALVSEVQAVPVAQTETAANVEKSGNLSWHRNMDDAMKEAQQQGKPLFVDFSASWCANCKEFDKLTQSDTKLNEALGKVVLCKIRDSDPTFKKFQADPRFPELKVGLPFLVVMDAKGNLLFKTSDYTRTDDMLLFLQ